eukprot:345509_1
MIIYNNNVNTTLVKLTELKMDKKKQTMIPMSYFEGSNKISCKFVLLAGLVADCDDENVWRWYGETGNVKVSTDHKNILFPTFGHDINDEKCVIRVNLQELQNVTSILLAEQEDINNVTFPRVVRTTFNAASL